MAQYTTVRIKFSAKKIIAIVIILAIVPAVYLYTKYVTPINTWTYEGRAVGFRINLREAQKIPVIANFVGNKDADFMVRDALVRDDVTNITFLFKPSDDKNNSLYVVEETEIIKALTFAYLYSPDLQLNQIPAFSAQAVDSYSNITASQFNPKIVMVHPNFGNATLVRQDGYITYVQGKSTNSFDSDKIQFDLATVRLMMAILKIKIQ
jgi:hypothetical protein